MDGIDLEPRLVEYLKDKEIVAMGIVKRKFPDISSNLIATYLRKMGFKKTTDKLWERIKRDLNVN